MEDKTNLYSKSFIINELKQAILNLLIANPNEDFLLKETTGNNFLELYMHGGIIFDVTRKVYQYHNQSDDLRENKDFKSDNEYIDFVNNMSNKKLKEQLQAFNREAVILEGRRNQIFFPISRDETIEKFKKFSGKSFSEVLLCVDEEHPHFKTSKNIILCLNQARECENLPDRQFSIFVKEYVEQLLDIIYKKMVADRERASIFAEHIESIILSEINKIAPQEINDGFRDFLRDKDSDTFIDFLKFFFNETPHDKDLNIEKMRKIVLEKQQQREQSLEANLKNQLRQVKKEQLVLDMKNFVLKGKKYLILTPLVLTIAGGALGYAKSSQTTLYRTITESYNVDTEEPVDEPYYVYDEHKTSYVATVIVYGPWRKNPNGTGYLRAAEAYTYTPKEDSNKKITREDLFDDETRLKYKYTQRKSQLEDSDSMENYEIIIKQTYQDADDTKKSTKYTLPAAALGLLIGLFVAFMTKSTKGYYIEKEFYRVKKRSEELEEIIREINKKLESPGNLDGAVEDLRSAYNNFIEIYGSNFEHKRLEKIASFLKTQEEAKKRPKTFSKILKK